KDEFFTRQLQILNVGIRKVRGLKCHEKEEGRRLIGSGSSWVAHDSHPSRQPETRQFVPLVISTHAFQCLRVPARNTFDRAGSYVGRFITLRDNRFLVAAV